MSTDFALVYAGNDEAVQFIHENFFWYKKKIGNEMPESIYNDWENSDSILQIIDKRDKFFDASFLTQEHAKYPGMSLLVFRNLDAQLCSLAEILCKEPKTKGVLLIYADGYPLTKERINIEQAIIQWYAQVAKK